MPSGHVTRGCKAGTSANCKISFGWSRLAFLQAFSRIGDNLMARLHFYVLSKPSRFRSSSPSMSLVLTRMSTLLSPLRFSSLRASNPRSEGKCFQPLNVSAYFRRDVREALMTAHGFSKSNTASRWFLRIAGSFEDAPAEPCTTANMSSIEASRLGLAFYFKASRFPQHFSLVFSFSTFLAW